MKKFLAILMALIMVLSLGVTAFADDVTPAADGGATAATGTATGATHADVTVEKTYTVTGGDGQTIPEETLTFTVTPDGGNPDTSAITVADLDTSKGLDITISFPTYTKMGVYKYNVHEEAGDTLGVTYDDTDIQVIVTVVNEKAGEGSEDVLKVYVAVYTLTENGDPDKKIAGDDPDKVEEDYAFENEYGLGKLTVTKTVTGNLASNTKEFDITVSFSGGAKAGGDIAYTLADGTTGTLSFAEDGTASLGIKLKHEASAVFTNIPAGVTYTVVEAEKHTQGDINSDEGYTVSYEGASATVKAGDDLKAAVKNEKKTEIQTGISLDSLPYILIAVAVVAALVIMVIRKRRYSED